MNKGLQGFSSVMFTHPAELLPCKPLFYTERGEDAVTPKQKRFCDEYLIDTNATQAAIRAGYSEKTAYSIGQRLLKDVEVSAYWTNKGIV